MSLQNRYTDAYVVARTVNGTGQTVKFVGLVVAVLVTLSGLVAASNLGASVGFAGLLLGVLVALPFYALGVLVSAQGQILKATLDTAVNTSPLLSHDEIRQILTRSAAPPPPLLQVPSYRLCSACGGSHSPEAATCHCGKSLDTDPLFTATGERVTVEPIPKT